MPEARTITTACPRNCFSTCGMRVTVEDGPSRRAGRPAQSDSREDPPGAGPSIALKNDPPKMVFANELVVLLLYQSIWTPRYGPLLTMLQSLRSVPEPLS